MKALTYRSYSLHNFRQIPQMKILPEEIVFDIEIVGHVLPFKVNNYVIEKLIDWSHAPEDPIFTLTFPRKELLEPHHYQRIAALLKRNATREEIKSEANKIRLSLNPHPAGQMQLNVPEVDGIKLTGMQHKYRETVLFFPSQGQTCHAYCTFCFRWPQFVGMQELKFAMRETELLVRYVKKNPEVTDVLFTGGDPLIMKTKVLASYIEPLINANMDNLQTIRIGTKAFGYWPYRFTHDADASELLHLFERIVKAGKNLAIMAHFNHPVELSTEEVKEAIRKVRSTGAQIRTQSPIMRNINDSAEVWAEMWRQQVNLNCIPYYMFIARDTGAQHYFAIPLVKAWNIYRKAYQKVSGVCRTVRGPSLSCTPGKVQIIGVSEINEEKVIVMRMLQGRNPDWVCKPFFARYDETATWLDELRPAFGKKEFFFERELKNMYGESLAESQRFNFE
ncbi:MAG: KamA family radical SAM protein [Chitinophagales bacterium]|nr:MAG: KamA family radical SAM protein [Chitinophagales bacterium]